MSEHGWKSSFEGFSAMRTLAYGEHAAPRLADPVVDGILAQIPATTLSPAASNHPEISAVVAAAQLVPPYFDIDDARRRLPRSYGNLGRRVDLSQMQSGNQVERLRRKERDAGCTEQEQRQRDADYGAMMDALEYGGQPGQCVVLHSKSVTFTPPVIRRDVIADEPTMQESDRPMVLAYPVPWGWSQHRVARMVARGCADCAFCDHWSAGRFTDDYLLVGCGAILRVFPTCDDCRTRHARDLEWRPGLDYVSASDHWFAETDYPDDRYI